jgi:general L-amino acid transport system substrate-binding protein
MGRRFLAVALGFAIALTNQGSLAGPVLDAVRSRGQLACGVGAGTPGFMQVDRQGKWSGLAVDICRGVAAALFADAAKVKFVPLEPAQRFPASQNGEVDLLAANSTFTLARDASIDFAGIYYFDGQGFLVRRSGAKNVRLLNNVPICVQSGTTFGSNLRDFARAQKLRFIPITFDRADEARTAFFAGRCDALTPTFPLFTRSSPAILSIRAHTRSGVRPSPRNRSLSLYVTATINSPTSFAGPSMP